MDGRANTTRSCSALVASLFVVFAPWIVAIYTTDPAVAPYATNCLRIVSTGFVFFAYGLVFTQSFNGAGDTWTPTWINLGCFWVWQIPLAWLLAIHLDDGPARRVHRDDRRVFHAGGGQRRYL